MSSKMTPKAKARLREIAAAKKGRDTLQGMDQTTGRVGFDWVMDQQASGPLPEVRIGKYGYVEYRDPEMDSWEDATDNDGDIVRITYWRTRKEKYPPIPWVRLKQCPQWVFDEFASRWTVRKIAFQSYKGPETGTEWETITVVPIDIAVAWFRFLWPEEDQWGRRVKKYFTGFTEGWIQKYPGVGAKLSVSEWNGKAIIPPEVSVVEKINADGQPLALVRNQSSCLWVHQDKWKVIG